MWLGSITEKPHYLKASREPVSLHQEGVQEQPCLLWTAARDFSGKVNQDQGFGTEMPSST